MAVLMAWSDEVLVRYDSIAHGADSVAMKYDSIGVQLDGIAMSLFNGGQSP